MASETLSVFAIVFYICLPINQKNKRQFNFLPLVKYLYFIFRITPTIDKEPKYLYFIFRITPTIDKEPSIFIFDYPTFFRDEGNIISSVNSLRNLIKPQNKNLPTEYSLSVGIAFIEILIYYQFA